MVELSMKDLKALLDDNDLDLSMRQLTTIPVKILSKIPRATHLDFSNNLITKVPSEFCFLTHITKLDLSNNHITYLPEEFGKLTNLAHLDLYKNGIEDLPVSFGELTSLKWLDLKGNPLNAELLKAAGDCLDEKGCKQAAVNVVRLMRERAAKQRRHFETQHLATKRLEDSNVINHGPVVQKEKMKKKKNKHRESIYEQLEPITEHTERNGIVTETVLQPQHGARSNKRCSSDSTVVKFLCRIFFFLFVSSLVTSAFAVIVALSNCVVDSNYWFASSKPLCNDLHTMMTDYSLPSTFVGNFFLAVASLLKSFVEATLKFLYELQHNVVIIGMTDYFHELYMNLVSVALLIQGYVLHKYEELETFYEMHVADTVNGAVYELWLFLRIIGLMLADLIFFVVGKGLLFISSVVETIFTYAHRGDQLIELLRNW